MTTGVFSRRAALACGGAAAMAPFAARAEDGAFSWGWLQAHALDLARRPYRTPPLAPAGVRAVDYDALNHIAYRPERELPGAGGVPAVRFFPLSTGASEPVQIALVEHGRVRDVDFSRALFTGAERLPAGVDGFSGFRLMNPSGKGDWLAFQGASYFRSAGALDQYGLSARGLAIDTGLARPEEFPRFTRFWLEPGPGDALTVYALLESPSATGAWRFVNRRADGGVTQDVSLTMRLRRDVERLGIAPLTSMFWYGEGDRAKAVDWRPEIHDSDGLAILTGRGERIWRPLDNPPGARIDSFADEDPQGFGLLQRDRAFDHYQDDGVFYERRPNLWIEPVGRWGRGAVTLFAMPTGGEIEDNVVAFWTPAARPRAGMRYDLDYRLHWTADEPPLAVARAVDCWRGTAGKPGGAPVAGATRLVADFAGDRLKGLGRDSGVAARVTLTTGTPLALSTYPVVGVEGRWRMIVDIQQKTGQTIDLRAFLQRGTAAMTETLLYRFP